MSKKLHYLEPDDTLKDLQDFFFPPYITLAHMFHSPEGWALKPRVLKQYQLQYALEGSADYRIEGTPYATTRGDLLLHCPNELHEVKTIPGKPYVCLSIVFHFGATDFPLGQLVGFDRNNSDSDRPHLMGNFSEHPLENQLSELIYHYRQPGLHHKQRSQHLLMGVLLTLADYRNKDSGSSVAKESSGTAKLILIRNYIDNNLRDGFRHEQLEKLSGWSRNYIILQFKRHFGMSPTQYLVWIRLEKAKELALQSGLAFGEIAAEVGYSDVHSFGKIFKRKMGISLSQFVGTLFRDTPDR
ncbi:helix-turn-helix transcriptional regulator [Cohnella silvisoli]|uniref:AraC family transcriptional regulator n=1 Tax=Cohnella silvisoli TaxID=2873699 RepID=A0ABV1KMT0_9BACL|nr:AraC family transcriptional regulator [Cohnella silvisoli]MCD9020301.1 AraC family transcriptional regulator [Cohnella silvisoli]